MRFKVLRSIRLTIDGKMLRVLEILSVEPLLDGLCRFNSARSTWSWVEIALVDRESSNKLRDGQCLLCEVIKSLAYLGFDHLVSSSVLWARLVR